MKVCTFFGHSTCCGLDREKLRRMIETLIHQGVDTFYVGNQGEFDACVRSTLKLLKITYPHIRYAVVFAYLPTAKEDYADHSDTMYPEGIENGHPKFAIVRRNRWMLERADHVICYVQRPWGGAYQFSQLASKKGKRVINLCDAGIAH